MIWQDGWNGISSVGKLCTVPENIFRKRKLNSVKLSSSLLSSLVVIWFNVPPQIVGIRCTQRVLISYVSTSNPILHNGVEEGDGVGVWHIEDDAVWYWESIFCLEVFLAPVLRCLDEVLEGSTVHWLENINAIDLLISDKLFHRILMVYKTASQWLNKEEELPRFLHLQEGELRRPFRKNI